MGKSLSKSKKSKLAAAAAANNNNNKNDTAKSDNNNNSVRHDAEGKNSAQLSPVKVETNKVKDKKTKKSIFSIKKDENRKIERKKHRESLKKRKKSVEEKVIVDPKNMTEQDYEASVQQKIKKLLQTDGEKFLLNFMLLSVQFYSNYERETYDTIDRNRKLENENTKRIAEHLKTVILADPVSDAIDRKVKFQARHGPLKHKLLSLDTQTMFIVFDNIEVSQPDDTDLYSTLSNTPAYKFVMEDHLYQQRQISTRISHKGYVKLRSIDSINTNLKKISVDSSPSTSSGIHSGVVTNSDDEFDVNSVQNVPMGKKSICYVNGIPFSTASNSSTSRGSSEYDYAYITAFNSHKPLSVFMTGSNEPVSTIQIPVSCITMTKREDEFESDGSETEEEADEIGKDCDEDEESTLKNTSVMGSDQRPYLNSKAFLSYFVNIFKTNIAFNLGFTQADLDKATWKAASVFVPPYEVIPAIHCPWPTEAFEWTVRERKPIEVPFTNQKYVWPTPKMVSDVVSFGCHVIPVGYAPKKGENTYRHIEWKVVFPQAERYLETKLTSAQIKVYMVMKTLFKTYIDTRLENGKNIFTKEHLRTQLFWLCEENYAAWNEEYLGEALLRYMKALLNSISKRCLPDYFLRDRNLLSNVPEKVVANLHKLVFRISEKITFYLLGAIRNLTYTKKFYPPFPVKKLYRFLIVSDPLTLLCPANFPPQTEEKKEVVIPTENVEHGVIDYFEKRDKRLKKRKPKINKDEPPELVRHNSVESINLEFKLPRIDQPRQKLIFHLFVSHLLEMAQKSMENGALNITLIYLNQAQRLSNILAEYGDEEESAVYLSRIDPMMRQTRKFMRYSSVTGPTLPSRGASVDPPNAHRKRSIGSTTDLRRKSEDSDDTLRATKIRPVVPAKNFAKVKAQVHPSRPSRQDEYTAKRREGLSSLAPPNERRDNVRIRA